MEEKLLFYRIQVEPHDKCLAWNHFWDIFRNNYYMESLQITDKLYLYPLIIF